MKDEADLRDADRAVRVGACTLHRSALWRRISAGTRTSLASVTAIAGTAIAWAAGYDGVLLVSHDGGMKWNRVCSGTERHLRSVCFVDEFRGHVGGWHVMLHTRDGGRTWCSTTLPSAVEAVRFVSPRLGVAVGRDGLILRTVDGGNEWRRVRSGTRRALRSLWLHGEREATVVGDQGTLLWSVDAGRTWALRRLGSADLRAVYFIDRQRGWLAGAGGTVAYTENGGRSWQRTEQAPTRHLLSTLVFADARTGWALGSGLGNAYAPVWRTEDGGRTWEREFSGTVDPINAATLVAGRVCAVGRFGTVLLRDLEVFLS